MAGDDDAVLSAERALIVAPGHGEALCALEQWHGAVNRSPAAAVPAVLPHIERIIACVVDPELRRAAQGLLQVLLRTPAGAELALSGSLTNGLSKGCGNTDGEVRWVCVQLIAQVVDQAVHCGRADEVFSSGIFGCTAGLVADERTDVGTRAAAALSRAAVAGGLPAFAAHPAAGDQLRAALGGRPEAALRLLDALAAPAAAQGGEALAVAEAVGALDAVADGVEAEHPDELLLLNYLEVLAGVAASPLGVAFFGRRPGLPARVTALCRAPGGDEATAGFAMRFVGRFAQFSSENGLHAVGQGWFDEAAAHLVSPTTPATLAERALEAVCSIARTPSGAARLQAHAEALRVLRRRMGAEPHPRVTREQRVVALHNVAAVFESPLLRDQGPLLQGLFEGLFSGEGALGPLLALRSDHDRDLRAAFHHLLQSLCGHPHAGAVACADMGFWAWLLDPDAETDKECKEYKYGTIQKLVLHCAAELEKLHGTQEVIELRTLARLGPFASRRSQGAVAMGVD